MEYNVIDYQTVRKKNIGNLRFLYKISKLG